MDAATCSKHEELFTYNEGLMLGAATALANATASPAYAADAARFAKHLVEKQTELKLGRVLVDSCDWGESPCHDCSQFKGIAYRELARWLRSGLGPSSTLQDRVRTLLDDSAAIDRPQKLSSAMTTTASPAGTFFTSYAQRRASLMAVSPPSTPVFIGSTLSY